MIVNMVCLLTSSDDYFGHSSGAHSFVSLMLIAVVAWDVWMVGTDKRQQMAS
jgi:hypothetical protein